MYEFVIPAGTNLLTVTYLGPSSATCHSNLSTALHWIKMWKAALPAKWPAAYFWGRSLYRWEFYKCFFETSLGSDNALSLGELFLTTWRNIVPSYSRANQSETLKTKVLIVLESQDTPCPITQNHIPQDRALIFSLVITINTVILYHIWNLLFDVRHT